MFRTLMVCGFVAFAGQAVAQAAPPAAPAQPAAPPAAPSTAPAAPEPQRTTATYGDWVLSCLHPDKASAVCELQQILYNQGNAFARTVIGRPNKSEPLHLGIVVPVNVNLPVQPRLTGGDNESGFTPVDLTWRRCVQQGCLADLTLTDDQLKRLRGRTDNAHITYQDATGKDVPLPFGPKGLSQGVDALIKEEAGK